jgi:hypothetical protein
MIIAESTEQLMREKERINTLMKVHGITRLDVHSKSEYHYNTICKALNQKESYWNKDIIALVEQMIEESQNIKPANA